MELKNKNRKENSKSQHDISNEKFSLSFLILYKFDFHTFA